MHRLDIAPIATYRALLSRLIGEVNTVETCEFEIENRPSQVPSGTPGEPTTDSVPSAMCKFFNP